MRLQVKNKYFLKHFPRYIDDRYVNQLYQIIKEFEVFEKMYFRFIFDR